MTKPQGIQAIKIHPDDHVAVAVEALDAGAAVVVDGHHAVTQEPIPAGHKLALYPLEAGAEVVKYGFPIGRLTRRVSPGAWIHTHNLATALEGPLDYTYSPAAASASNGHAAPGEPPTFLGYRRKNGRVGTRNEVWVLNTVACVNAAAERVARLAEKRFGALPNVDGFHAFSHPYGCSQLGDDLAHTQRVLAGLLRHPNAGGVLVLGLGCENNQMEGLLAQVGDVDRERLRFFNAQAVTNEIEAGLEAVEVLAGRMAEDERVPCPVSDLVLGLKCGGSDGFSGITANPLVGRVAERVAGLGGGVVLTEVPEMFGAEQVLMNRATSRGVFEDLVRMIDGFKAYFTRHGQPIYENPSPGNKDGGLTTLEEKSLGAIQKGGRVPVARVLRYGEAAAPGGLSLLEAPGNDGVSSTALTAAGATVLLFTTGRGTPLGFPAPTVKIASNSPIARQKPHWIDFDAGRLLSGAATMDDLAAELFRYVLDVASGHAETNNEQYDYREIAIWKDGVTL